MIRFSEKNTNSFAKISIGLCFAVICFYGSVFSQVEEKRVSVSLKSNASFFKKTDSIAFRLTIQNKSRETLYLVTGEKARPSYSLTSRKLSFSLELQTANYQLFKFPSLRKLKPKSKTELEVTIPVAAWSSIEPGKRKIHACVGVLPEKELKNKPDYFGTSSKNKSPTSIIRFLELQRISCSNSIEIMIVDANETVSSLGTSYLPDMPND